MRRLFLTTGVVLFVATALCVLRFAAGGPHAFGWSILSAGLALAGGLCYLSASSLEAQAVQRSGERETKTDRRLRFNLLTAMTIVALAAVLFAWVAVERRKWVDTLTVDYQRLEERVRWAEVMHGKGYISKSQLTADQVALRKVQSQLEMLGAPPESR